MTELDYTAQSPSETIVMEFNFLIESLKEFKPNDRSEQDRYWAITVTEVEKALALFKTFAASE